MGRMQNRVDFIEMARECKFWECSGVLKRVDMVLTVQAILALHIHPVSHSPNFIFEGKKTGKQEG
jgi:hypothetical protein